MWSAQPKIITCSHLLPPNQRRIEMAPWFCRLCSMPVIASRLAFWLLVECWKVWNYIVKFKHQKVLHFLFLTKPYFPQMFLFLNHVDKVDFKISWLVRYLPNRIYRNFINHFPLLNAGASSYHARHHTHTKMFQYRIMNF